MAKTAKAKPKRKPGEVELRPGNVAKYVPWTQPDGLLQLTAWARDGLTKEEIARKVGVARATLGSWESRIPEIKQALSRGKDPFDIEIENSMHNRAKGYTVQLRKTFKIKRIEYDDQGRKVKEFEELVQGFDEVHIPADVTAQIFWLKNRKPADWKDKRETTATVGLDVEDLTGLAELLKL